jgi:hypothetical protein
VEVLTLLHPPCAALRDGQGGEVKLALARVEVHDMVTLVSFAIHAFSALVSGTHSRVSASDRLRLRWSGRLRAL